MAENDLDIEKVRALAQHVFSYLGGTAIAGMVYLGDHLGLYRALDGSSALTSDELASKTGLSERWLREWLRGQAAAGLIDYRGEGRFALSAEAALVLANEHSPAFLAGGFAQMPALTGVLEKLPQAFETGLGLPYDALGPDGARGVERLLAPFFRTMLVPSVLPQLDGVVAKLERGAKVADVGCGGGVALIAMAQAYPRSEFAGYDISKHALERAEANKKDAGVNNATFHDANGDGLPADHSFDLVTAFDCLHDMTNPGPVMRAVRNALKPDGTWLIADVKTAPTFEENLEKNPYTAMMYGFSVLTCMSSALSEPGGAGLGTLGFTEPVAREMTSEAGFSRFRRVDVESPFQAYYEVRP